MLTIIEHHMPKHPTRSISLGLLIVALALRFFRLSSQSLWLDEGGTWSEATGRSWLPTVSFADEGLDEHVWR